MAHLRYQKQKQFILNTAKTQKQKKIILNTAKTQKQKNHSKHCQNLLFPIRHNQVNFLAQSSRPESFVSSREQLLDKEDKRTQRKLLNAGDKLEDLQTCSLVTKRLLQASINCSGAGYWRLQAGVVAAVLSQNTKIQFFLSQKCRFRAVIQKMKYLRSKPTPHFILP